MIRITGDDDIASLARGSFREMLYACDEWAGCVDHFGGAFFELALHLRGDAVRANNGNRVGVSFVR